MLTVQVQIVLSRHDQPRKKHGAIIEGSADSKSHVVNPSKHIHLIVSACFMCLFSLKTTLCDDVITVNKGLIEPMIAKL